MSEYLRPLQPAQAEFIEKKSRFIGYITPADSEEQALAFLKAIREKHRDASHNVYAYHIKNGGFCRHSDDGEPGGTAGLPLLEVFTQQKVFDFCCVATRYFGGTLLGAGGLTRAYARIGAASLEAAGLAVMRTFSMGKLICEYTQYETVKRSLDAAQALIEDTLFTDCVTIAFSLPENGWTALTDALTAATAGTVFAELTGTAQRPQGVQCMLVKR